MNGLKFNNRCILMRVLDDRQRFSNELPMAKFYLENSRN